MQRSVGTAWITEASLVAMVEDAHRAYPSETGGVLLGYWASTFDEVVITDVIGPGPEAMHAADRFVPDAAYQEGEIARRYRSAPQLYGYLGDWHSHPFGRDRPSRRDRHTLRAIGEYLDARAPVPLMGILVHGEQWILGIWRYLPDAAPRLRIARLDPRLCAPPTIAPAAR